MIRLGGGNSLTIARSASVRGTPADAIQFAEVKEWVRSGGIVRRLLRYGDVRLRTQLLELLPRPLVSALIVRSLSHGSAVIEDEEGKSQRIGPMLIASLGRDAVRDWRARGKVLSRVSAMVERLDAQSPSALNPRGRPLYLRTDFVFGLASGGSVGHIAGVVNNLTAFGRPILATTDRIPTVSDDVETWLTRPDGRFREFVDVPSIEFNLTVSTDIERRLDGGALAFVYQRYSLNNITGLEIARRHAVPFVLEYNGSEIWISRQWGGTEPRYGALSERIELANLRGADLIVVVSDVMRDELIQRGIDGSKILVNPNGVDTDVYRPDVDGTAIRREIEAEDKVVLGFIGTFGPWHGAEVLAKAFGELLRRRPEHRDRLRLLMIGDGDRLPATKAAIDRAGATAETTFVGRTRQEDGPRYLAAADILVSPHVPNADGSRFFGSPTKLFEYMAMGRGIVASDLEQIGAVLQHDRTGWLVEPGSVDALADGLTALIDDEERRRRLGAAAREEAIAKHTWRAHTDRILARVKAFET